MSMFSNLCSCFPLEIGRDILRHGYDSVINFLSSKQAN